MNLPSLTLAAVAAALVAALLVCVVGKPPARDTIQAQNVLWEPEEPQEVDRSHKTDRLPLLLRVADLQEPPLPAPGPPPLPPARPVIEASKPAPGDICTYHGGWKVVTNGGKSWRCAFPGR
jgi:hypothetical protein